MPIPKIALRKWTKATLHLDDYRFAISEKPDDWDCLAGRLWNKNRDAAKRLVVAMLDWETKREFTNFTMPPFLSVKEHQELIEAVQDDATKPKPAQIEPLREIPLANVRSRVVLRDGFDVGISVHAFEIERDEDTDITEQRFRNWLVQFKKTPDQRGKWVDEIDRDSAKGGRKRFDAILYSLAVRRLKEAGFKRAEVEKCLGLRPYFLNPLLKNRSSRGDHKFEAEYDQWTQLPKRAEKEINCFASILRKIG